MCGITGYILKNKGQGLGSQLPLIKEMTDSLIHRGPDDWGVELIKIAPGPIVSDGRIIERGSGELVTVLGHRRLSVIDPSPMGRQPMSSADGTCVIVFNGEIYNHVELRVALEQDGVCFRTNTDTEVLLEGYVRFGGDFFRKLDGMFGFAIWDGKKRKLVCARDPLSIKPFYYGQDNDRFVFGSEPRSVLLGLGTDGHIDAARISEFLIFGLCDHDSGTSYREVSQLRGGEVIEVDSDGVISRRYSFWDIREFAPRTADPYGIEETRHLIEQSVERQLRADVPIGACLSGGIDSGSVVTTAVRSPKLTNNEFHAVTLYNSDFDGDESASAKALASSLGIRSSFAQIDERTLANDVERLAYTMGEPFSGLSMLAGYKVMQKSSELGLKVMLNGQGGDELFLGYPRNAHRAISDMFASGRKLQAVKEWLLMRRHMEESLHSAILSPFYFNSPKISTLRNRSRQSRYYSMELLSEARQEVASSQFGFTSTRETQVNDLTSLCLPRLLKFEDRNSMAWGVETRVPLLSTPLVERALQLPVDLRLRDGWTKYALRMAMNDRLPHDTVWQTRKRGFEVPAKRWMSILEHPLRDLISELPYDFPINRERLLREISSPSGSSQWFWRAISVALWARVCGVKV